MKKWIWIVCRICFILLIFLTFSPIVLPQGKTNPMLWGMPLTLWSGLVISLCFILLTLVGSLVINSPKKKS